MTGTSRFGLTLSGALNDHDKQLIDAVLAALELHDHSGGEQLADPESAPTAVLATTGGRLSANTTFSYRLSLVDQFGLESGGSAEISVTTPASVATPGIPVATVIGSGGTLQPGVYAYTVAAVDASGAETALTTAVNATVLVANSSVSVLGRAVFPTGAVAYAVYRRGPRTTNYTRLGTITVPTTPFLDDGSIPDDPYAKASRLAGVNATNATNMITVAPSTADLVRTSVSNGPIRAWRIYRATASGSYSSTSLLAEVNTTVNPDGTGGLLTSFIDDGNTALSAGRPLDSSQTLHPSIPVAGGAPVISIVTLASASSKWRLACYGDGALVAVPSANLIGSGGLFLASPAGAWWRVSVSDLGGLTTTASAPALGDRAYTYDRSPILPTPDPLVSYQLAVDNLGALTTASVGSTF